MWQRQEIQKMLRCRYRRLNQLILAMTIPDEDLKALRTAKELLENPGLAVKLTNFIGKPIEKGFDLLPSNWSERVSMATQGALQQALGVAVKTLGESSGSAPSNFGHKLAVMASGAAGGAFGLPGLAVELPVSTTIMLRSIGDIARSEGEDLKEADAKLECIRVFALGGESEDDDAAESAYFAVRMALAKTVTEAAKHVAKHGIGKEVAPVLVKLVEQVAARFGIQVSQKMAAQAVPVIGAAGGALINTLFMDHFQDMAHGHFTVRRLERSHGEEVVRKAYEQL